MCASTSFVVSMSHFTINREPSKSTSWRHLVARRTALSVRNSANPKDLGRPCLSVNFSNFRTGPHILRSVIIEASLMLVGTRPTYTASFFFRPPTVGVTAFPVPICICVSGGATIAEGGMSSRDAEEKGTVGCLEVLFAAGIPGGGGGFPGTPTAGMGGRLCVMCEDCAVGKDSACPISPPSCTCGGITRAPGWVKSTGRVGPEYKPPELQGISCMVW
mmetsp:Transcript_6359/g.8749  ORF Transcript_6359/g.8749 Transcript_6359/m.8749 type:complete len:218 (-) Transcript_6359:452-1105(-)